MTKTVTLKLPEIRLNRLTRRRGIILAVAIMALLSLIFWKDIFVFAVYRDSGEREVQRLLLDLSPHIIMPQGELPALATITDKSILNQGGVLKDAKNGDELLLYYESGKVYVYRPSVRKVVAVGPLTIDPSAQQVAGTTITLRNGSGNNEKFSEILKRVKQRYPSAVISDEGPAARSDYPKTIVIDLTDDGKKVEFTKAIGELIDGQSGILPIGEQKPAKDILIIVGTDAS
jgi:hypothetical protein